ncbi:hypothetical protein cyc_07977 [Cyclospora cayetanensis]|uniref:Uncharacterized protein n=1 Tax=Cyclospora cayetanensis TaxID=88456 RepID=A0A1D3DAN2_9EIME|nr:hypothetical protein cyc_07977 [Cyclospora cayetanensis]
MPHIPPSEAPPPCSALLELTPVGGRLSIVASLGLPPPPAISGATDLVEELDKLGLGCAHRAEYKRQSPEREPWVGSQVGQPAGNVLPRTTDGLAEGSTLGSNSEWSFRLSQQQMLDGQQALRLSVWCGLSNGAGGPARPSSGPIQSTGALPGAVDATSSKETAGGEERCVASEEQAPSVYNFYFRLPCSLPSLKLLGASCLPLQGDARTRQVAQNTSKGEQHQVTALRLSMQCDVRPASLAESIQEKEDRILRALHAFRLSCRRCGEDFANLREAQLLLLPSAIWTEAREVVVRLHVRSPTHYVPVLMTPQANFVDLGRVCVGPDKIFIASCDVKGLLRGPKGPCSERNFASKSAVSCGSCGAVLGVEKQRAQGRLLPQATSFRGSASFDSQSADEALSSHARIPATEDGIDSAAACCGLRSLPASGGRDKRQEAFGQVCVLKRRISLHPGDSGASTDGPNLFFRHSDLSAFAEDLCSYSREAAALRFLVLPFTPPKGAERPWEIGRQAPPARSHTLRASGDAICNHNGPQLVSAVPWVSCGRETTSLELRILLRECFVAAGGTREGGSPGFLAMKVILRVLNEARYPEEIQEQQRKREEKYCEEKQVGPLCGGSPTGYMPVRMHLARVSVQLFEEVLRLARGSMVGENFPGVAKALTLNSLGLSSFKDESKVAFLPLP